MEKLSELPDLLRRGYSQKQVLLLVFLFQANLGAIALVTAYASRTLALGMFILLGLMFVLFYKIMNDYRLSVIKLEEIRTPEKGGANNCRRDFP